MENSVIISSYRSKPFFIDFVSFVEHIRRCSCCFLLPQSFQMFHKSSAYDVCEVFWMQSFMWGTVHKFKPYFTFKFLFYFCMWSLWAFSVSQKKVGQTELNVMRVNDRFLIFGCTASLKRTPFLLFSVTEAFVSFPYLKFAHNRIKAYPVPCGFLYL